MTDAPRALTQMMAFRGGPLHGVSLDAKEPCLAFDAPSITGAGNDGVEVEYLRTADTEDGFVIYRAIS